MTTGASSWAVVMTFDLISSMPNNNTDITMTGMAIVEISVRRSRSFFRWTVKMFFQFMADFSADFPQVDDLHEDLFPFPTTVAGAEGAASLKRLPLRRA